MALVKKAACSLCHIKHAKPLLKSVRLLVRSKNEDAIYSRNLTVCTSCWPRAIKENTRMKKRLERFPTSKVLIK